MNTILKSKALEHAKAEYPREACGLIVRANGDLHYFPCRNISDDPSQFALAPEDYARAEDEGEIEGVVHSHCDRPATPSPADLKGCEDSRVPWHIVSVPGEAWEQITPSGYEAPYLGRSFVHGIFDCFSLIRDWYSRECGIELPDYERADKWWTSGQNLYMKNYEHAGFTATEDPLERGDVIIMQIGSRVPNHAGIYIGRDLILHHLREQLSRRDVYGGYWRKNTRLVVRHREIRERISAGAWK